jgi:hypothetical protein
MPTWKAGDGERCRRMEGRRVSQCGYQADRERVEKRTYHVLIRPDI